MTRFARTASIAPGTLGPGAIECAMSRGLTLEVVPGERNAA